MSDMRRGELLVEFRHGLGFGGVGRKALGDELGRPLVDPSLLEISLGLCRYVGILLRRLWGRA